MHLYTILLDYAGGTYVAQAEAMDEDAALRGWLGKLRSGRIADAVWEEVAAAFEEAVDRPLPLDGLAGAWCASASASQGLALVNIVKTAPQANFRNGSKADIPPLP